jgi:excisionase family DNA binding protein
MVRVIRAAATSADGENMGPAYYDAKTAPMGRTTFLRLAREGAFPARKVGRKVLARKSDVDAWIQGGASSPLAIATPPAAPPIDGEVDALRLHDLILEGERKGASAPAQRASRKARRGRK